MISWLIFKNKKWNKIIYKMAVDRGKLLRRKTISFD